MSEEARTPEVEDPHIRPFAEVTLMGEKFFVLESPKEVAEKAAAVIGSAEDRMGLGMVEAEQFSNRLLQLTGLDIWANREGSIEVDLFELAAPALPTLIRGLSEKWWANFLAPHRRGPAPPGGGLGVTVASGLAELLGRGRAVPMRAEVFEERRALDCCCGHQAGAHVLTTGDEFVGECSDPECPCRRFHTHEETA